MHYDILIVGGYGHIGLPLGMMLADAGCHVALFDIDKSREATILAGEMPFLEYDAEPILKRVIGKTLHTVDNISAIQDADSIIITIGTPLDEYLNPSLMQIMNLAEAMLPYLRPEHLLILRSTVFPGTSENLRGYFEKRGVAAHLAFCPERIAEGYAIRELKRLPQIVSGFSPKGIALASAVFERLGQEILVTDVLEAELAKLFSNAWRYIQFATANQFYMIASQNGADFQRIHHAMTYHYDRASDFPKAGFAAGPCLLKDTMQLSAFHQNNFMLGHNAMLVNEGLPSFIVTQLAEKFDFEACTVGLLGMAFKAEVDDIRDSLSYKLGKLLRFQGAKVLYTDEYAQDPTFLPAQEVVDQCDIVIVCAPHRAYKNLVIPSRVHIVDVWGFINHG